MLNGTGSLALAELLVKTRQDRLAVLRIASYDFFLVASQAQDLVDRVQGSCRPLDCTELAQALAVLLPRVVDAHSVTNLLERNLSREQVQQLAAQLGGAFALFCGAWTGRHTLDLSVQSHRAALYKLVQHDAIAQEQQRRAFGDDDANAAASGEDLGKPGVYAADPALLLGGGTSQRGDMRGFRNAFLNAHPVEHCELERMAVGFSSSGAHDPFCCNKGKRELTLDFVSTMREHVARQPTTENRLETLLHSQGAPLSQSDVMQNPRLLRLLPTFLFKSQLVSATAKKKANVAERPIAQDAANLCKTGSRSSPLAHVLSCDEKEADKAAKLQQFFFSHIFRPTASFFPFFSQSHTARDATPNSHQSVRQVQGARRALQGAGRRASAPSPRCPQVRKPTS